jgi:hypothetical protein
MFGADTSSIDTTRAPIPDFLYLSIGLDRLAGLFTDKLPTRSAAGGAVEHMKRVRP